MLRQASEVVKLASMEQITLTDFQLIRKPLLHAALELGLPCSVSSRGWGGGSVMGGGRGGKGGEVDAHIMKSLMYNNLLFLFYIAPYE